MNRDIKLAVATAVLLSSTYALASNVRTDYDKGANFASYKTYSWGTVSTANPLIEDRVKAEISRDLQAKGWQLVPSGGSATVFANDKVKNEQELETTYNGFGDGGWGGRWGWGGWGGFGGGYGPGGFGGGGGEATTTTETQRVGHFVVDIFDASTHKLLFRGVADNNLSNNSSKNSKGLSKDVDAMLKKLPSDSKS